MGIMGFKIIAKQRARLVGELQAIEKKMLAELARVLELRSKISAIEKNKLAELARVQELRSKISAFDEVLNAQGVDIDADDYASPVSPTPRLYYFAHGELTGTCLSLLRTQRRPLTPFQMFDALVQMKQPMWRNPEDPRKVRQIIKHQMGVSMRRGLVVHVGSAGPAHNNAGIWSLLEYANVPWDPAAITLPAKN